ncbi:Sjogren's syndrome/scleroderma autoantigen 1 family protein [Natrinema sp. SYSU A 869]|uniref:Sjogren's syndrome/scleroderma autoantigen 1 family protein n=1 Tax=Natrinema sp. SYSU A 869 TaxID=2871694 RepID=UPI001CA396C4|nr:Sjogren's syndrome/scleroderma autoantigen 1 family protein [Natrinema sp. SYSU A 869]
MSDFDKEAEREKLREKYEQDKEEREATQRMSDLLLKGATMTNAHCGTCGDPLFQENGTTFCPSCHGNPDAVQGTELEAQSAAEGSTDGETATGENTDRTDGADTATPDTDDAAATAAETASDQDATPATDQRGTERGQETNAPTADRQPQPSASAARDDHPSPSQPDTPSADRTPSSSRTDDRPSGSDHNRPLPATGSSAADGDLEAARDALARTLEKFAEEAAATDDPRYAKDCLEAAREAGEALATLR